MSNDPFDARPGHRGRPEMLRYVAIAAIAAGVCASCDTFYPISASRRLREPLEESCVLETLRMEKAVRNVELRSDGIWVELIMPADLKGSTPYPFAGMHMRSIDEGEFEIEFESVGVNHKESDGYNAHLQGVLEDLRDRVIEKCSGR